MKGYKIYVSIILSICLILGVHFGIITLGTMQSGNNNSIHEKTTSNESQWLGRFVSSEQYNRTMDDIKPLSGSLLISPDNSWHIRKRQLEKAQTFLYVWIYNITLSEAQSIIKNKAKQGTEVKMIIEDNKYGPDQEQEPRGWGIQTKNDQKLHTNFVHAKTLISQDFYIIQTANLTYSAFHNQREYFVIGTNSEINQNLKDLFRLDWDGHRIHSKDIHPNIVFCPTDCRHKITTLLSSAKESIYIQNQYIDDEEIIGILQDQYNAGIDLKVNLPLDEKDGHFTNSDYIKYLKSPRIHAKAMLIDKKYLLISSINFSQNSLDNNREIGIILTDSNSINNFLKQFDTDWSHSYYTK